jgi:hypothetical protein
MRARRRRRSSDGAWALVLAAAFVFGVVASWQRWANPLIDFGREMQVPLRLAMGEVLYLDVRHLYGPLSPYLHAALFRAFGPSLGVLYAAGIACAVVALALVHRIARRLMPPFAAGTATLAVMWLCVFKPAGNYIAPYSYNALHGTVLALATVVLSLEWLGRSAREAGTGRRAWIAAVAGVAAGLALLAKLELGAAAAAAGAATTVAVLPQRLPGAPLRLAWREALAYAVPFAASALAVGGAGYAWMASACGWAALMGDSYLRLQDVPPALAHYNAWVSGLDHPARSVSRMLAAAAKMGCLVAIVLAVSQLSGRRTPESVGAGAAPVTRPPLRPVVLLGAAAALLLFMSLVTGFDWDKGPYLAMPVLLVWLLWSEARRLLARGDEADGDTAPDPRVVFVCAAAALVSLGRMILHVRSGGAYGSYLLPLSVVLFTYTWAVPFGDWCVRRTGRRLASDVMVWLLLLDAVATAGILAHRYRARYTVPIAASRGTMIAEPGIALAWREALAFIEARTRAGDAVAVAPEGTSLLFLAERRNPLREEITTPGFLDGPAEARAIARMQAAGTRLVLVANRPTSEFGPRRFGHDYAVALWRWIEAEYVACGQFGPGRDPSLQVGDRPFFVRAYCRRNDASAPIRGSGSTVR